MYIVYPSILYTVQHLADVHWMNELVNEGSTEWNLKEWHEWMNPMDGWMVYAQPLSWRQRMTCWNQNINNDRRKVTLVDV